MGKSKEPQDPGDLLEVSEDQREDVDPDPAEDEEHAALGDGGPDDVSDVEEGEYVDPATYREGES
jgi:hypothetical protein